MYGCWVWAHVPPGIDLAYEDSCGQLFATVARCIVEQDNSLEILAYCEELELEGDSPDFLKSIDSLERHHIPNSPSWAPNWAAAPVAGLLPGQYDRHDLRPKGDIPESTTTLLYRASGSTIAEYTFSHDDLTLSVSGIFLDNIVDTSMDLHMK